MPTYIAKIYRSIAHAIRGLIYAYRNDKSFYMEIEGGILYIILIGLLWPISLIEFFFLTLSYVLILLAELVNTSLEVALRKLHPEKDSFVGASKDIAAGAVLVAFVFAVIVVAGVVISRFW